MKKILTVLAASAMMLISMSASAQFSVGAGYLNSSAKTKTGNTVTSSPMNGFYAGGEYLISEGSGFGVSAGAYFEYLMSNKSYSSFIASAETKTRESYLDIPVHFNYSVDLPHALRAYVFAGPDFSIGLSSKVEASASIGGISSSGELTDMYDDMGLKRFDILMGAGAGVDYNDMLRFKIGYDLGLLNRIDSDNSSLKRNLLHVGVAFLF